MHVCFVFDPGNYYRGVKLMNSIPDIDGDGKVDQADIDLQAASDAHDKTAVQSRITISSFVVMVLLAAILMSGLIPDDRIKALSPLISSTLFIGFCGVIGAYFGMTGYMSRK